MATTTTTISLRMETKEMPRRLGSKRRTYDDVIRDLIERAAGNELDARWNRILEGEEFIPLDELCRGIATESGWDGLRGNPARDPFDPPLRLLAASVL